MPDSKPDALPPEETKHRGPPPGEKHQEEVLDEALEETFPASDPISPAIPDGGRKDPA